MSDHTAETDRPASVRSGDLEVRLAHSDAEIEAAQRLRFHIFYREMAAKPTAEMAASGRDFDAFDPFADHLLVLDRGFPCRWLAVALTARGIATELSRRAGGVAALLPWATLRGGARFALLGAGATAPVAAVFAGAAGHGAAGDRLAGDGDAAFTRLGANAAAGVAAVLAGAAGGGAARGSAATAASSIAATAGAAVGGRIVFDGAAATDGEGEAREHEGGEEAHAPCVARHVPAIFPGESPRAGTRGTHPGVSVTT